jgi:hypothetical protein
MLGSIFQFLQKQCDSEGYPKENHKCEQREKEERYHLFTLMDERNRPSENYAQADERRDD